MLPRALRQDGRHRRDRWRRAGFLTACVLAVIAVACAQPGAPPGGPPDAEVPVLLRVLPESNAVNVRTPAVVLRFDEVISERSTGSGGQAAASGNTLGTVLVLSPSDGRDEVIWRRTNLELRPRRGFRANTTYRVTVTPGLADLRGNQTSEALDFVFSTGPNLAVGEVRGVLFDWTTGRVAANARVELFKESDSTFRWMARSDSSGRFQVRDLDAGSYEVRAWVDANNDRRISFREISDSARVALTDTATLELYAFARDTMPPRIENVEMLDSTGIRVRFDRGIVLDWDGREATLLAADSTVIPLGGVLIPSPRYDSLAAARRAVADSIAADSIAADSVPTDSVPTDSVPTDSVPTDSVPTDSISADSAATDSIPPDSVATDTMPPGPVFKRQVPETSWSLPLSAPLSPGSYRLRIRGGRGLNGRAVDSDREFRVRPPAPTTDSTAAPVDSTRPPADSTQRPAGFSASLANVGAPPLRPRRIF